MLHKILIGYCIAAALILTGWLIKSSLEVRGSSRQVDDAAAQIAEISPRLDSALTTSNALEEKQRLERSGYTPEQAVRVSAEVQEALKYTESLKTQKDSLEEQLAALKKSDAAKRSGLIPVIGGIMLHLLLIPFVYAQGGRAERKRKSSYSFGRKR